jgi:hypothetical protein
MGPNEMKWSDDAEPRPEMGESREVLIRGWADQLSRR